ncbi:hypothetical protein [Spiroplasma apis]|uniref:Uncharacterized protein n=1 Tax=Spiroplasma apis B31 TaxID=1276258 RepID=V5RHY4_SPIAP|nr:hypothetical protein [Spiroplasma apis]AHB36058.1 hypothetical protein SAPIS_v1c02120 [Spiroplasma apis B31]
MKGLKLTFGLLSTIPTILISTNVISCGKDKNMVQVFCLDNRTGKPWTNYERAGITTLDKTKVKKYTLQELRAEGLCKITFYFDDGSFDNTQNKWWEGYKYQYISYFKNLLNLDYIEE